MAHLLEQLGEERFAALIDSDNTGKVKDFCDMIAKSTLPTEMTIGGRTYKILSFLREDETPLMAVSVMASRTKEINANLDQDDWEFLVTHQDEIPSVFRGKVIFVFLSLQGPSGRDYVACVLWDNDRWHRGWFWLACGLFDNLRLLRRK